MLDTVEIDARLREMQEQPDPALLWDENCEGSARALVVFVGPSPAGKKPPTRRPLKKNCQRALWNKSFDRPLTYSRGFRVSFEPLVKALFDAPYETAGKLIGRANLDWLPIPTAKEVPEECMTEGAPSVLRTIRDCSPELVLPMDWKAFRILKTAIGAAGFGIHDCAVKHFLVRISTRRSHREVQAFRATSGHGSFLVIKLPQHPARMFQADYGSRCGQAIRTAAIQIASGRPVDVTVSSST